MKLESKLARWSVLILVSIVMAANYYFYDALSPLKSILQAKLSFTNSEYGTLMAAYSFSNVFLFMAVLGGIILDKLGIRITGFSFTFLMAIGSILTAYGASETFSSGGLGYGLFNSFLTKYSPELKMMIFGFFLFGLGAETSIVVITKIVVKWFRGKELAFALGINLAIARVGQGLAFNFSRPLSTEDFWTRPIWFAAILLSLALVLYMIYMIIDKKFDKYFHYQASIDETEKFVFSDIFKFITKPSYIFITLLCVTFYAAFFPLLKYLPDLLHNKYGFDADYAGNLTSIPVYSTVLFTPIFGWFVDNKGKGATVMIFSSILLIISFLLITFTSLTPFIPLSLLGISFSLIPAAMWPSVAKIVEEKALGTAYGLMFSLQNWGLFLLPILIGVVLDRSNPGTTAKMIEEGMAVYDYTQVLKLLSLLGIAGLTFAVLLKYFDKKNNVGIELPNIEKKNDS
jgi:MFS family permease